ncbi:hypothetical protein [Modestobacter caceresii]|uniref:hypothetical protein n=1 Tax=Modestobacter caceresii TaxID=1522368 RepID=UPI0012E011D9|nr:hypothetical protein [Modestobacter caceresii]
MDATRGSRGIDFLNDLVMGNATVQVLRRLLAASGGGRSRRGLPQIGVDVVGEKDLDPPTRPALAAKAPVWHAPQGDLAPQMALTDAKPLRCLRDVDKPTAVTEVPRLDLVQPVHFVALQGVVLPGSSGQCRPAIGQCMTDSVDSQKHL